MAGTPETPYVGLRPFEFEDSRLFFGRTRQIHDLFGKLRAHRFLAVVGRSGSGKSSLVKAGLLPLLAKETDSGGRLDWHVEVLRPRGVPIQNLTRSLCLLSERLSSENQSRIALRNKIRTSRLKATILRSSFGLTEVLSEFALPSAGRILLVVDQFEDIFRYHVNHDSIESKGRSASRISYTQSENERLPFESDFDEAAAFVRLLLNARSSQDSPLHVLLTMRLDFLGECARFRDLPEAINESQYLVPSLTRHQRREAILGPAEAKGWKIEPILLQRLLNDSGEDLDQLPLLQHTLMRTAHAAAARKVMRLKHYEDVGGISHALSNHAQEIYDDLGSKKKRGIAEQLFKAITELDRDGRSNRRPQRFGDIAALIGDECSQLKLVIDAFRAEGASFLTPSLPHELTESTQIDISHEVLIRKWDQLSGHAQHLGWVREEAIDGQTYRTLLEAANVFAKEPKEMLSPSITSLRLAWWERKSCNAAWAERYGGGFDRVQRLLAASEANRKAEQERKARYKRQSRWIAILAISLLALIGIVAFGIKLAADARRVAELERAQRTTAEHLAESRRRETIAAKKRAVKEAKLRQEAEHQRSIAEEARIRTEAARQEAEYQRSIVEEERIRTEAALVSMKDAQRAFSELRWQNQVYGRTAEAYEDDLKRYSELAKASPDVYLPEIGATLNSLGNLHREQNRLSKARSAYEEALKVYHDLAESKPVFRQDVAATLNNLGNLYRTQDRLAEASDALEDALAIARGLAQTNPQVHLRTLAMTQTNLGDVLVATGDTESARELYELSKSILERIVEADPTDSEAKRNLRVIQTKLGDRNTALTSREKDLIERLVLDRAAAIVSMQQKAEAREAKLWADLTAKDRQLRSETRSRNATADLSNQLVELAQLTAERQRLVDELAAKDRQFAAEITEYRRQVTSIADSPDPRKREALARYAEGDKAGAIEALLEIQDAEMKALAAGWREIVALALSRRDSGEMKTAEIIPIYEEVIRLDPENARDWIELGRLFQEAGNLDRARRAMIEAVERARNDLDRSAASRELGNVLLEAGELAEARERYESSLAINERLAEANPTNANNQRDLAISLSRLATVGVAAGDLAAARQRFELALAINERLAETDPTSADAQRDLSVSLSRLAAVGVAAGDLAAARQRFEQALAINQRLAEANPTSAAAQRDLTVSLNNLGEVEVMAGNLAVARQRFEQALAINQRLAGADPTSADAQRDLAVSLNNLGEVEVAGGDLDAARRRFEQALVINERLAEANPISAAAQLDLAVRLNNLGEAEVAAGDLAAARRRFEQALAINSRLAEADPTSAAAQRDLAVSLNNLGEVEVAGGDLDAARRRFEHALAINRRLAEANPTSAEAQRDVSLSLNNLGDVETAAGNLTAALALFEESLAIQQRLAENDPTSAAAQRDLIVSHVKLAALPGGEHQWLEALAIAEKLQRNGLLAPRDAWMIDELRGKAKAVQQRP